MQEFYHTSSAADQGTLCQLRNVVHRVDVSGAEGVTEKFRAHYAFVMDCLDAYILGAAMEVMGLTNVDEIPKTFKPPSLLYTSPQADQLEFLSRLGNEILEKHVKMSKDRNLTEMREEAQEMDTQMTLVNEMFHSDENRYTCTCGKKYKTLGFFKRHLQKEHNWLFTPGHEKPSSFSKNDSIAAYRASFMKNALLLRDTYDAYNLCDGNRILRNAKFEMVCADVRKHNKYRLWLWRFQAYATALLSPKEAFEYKWNCSANTTGGIDKNIPNDNLVELMVQLVKKKIKEQGANFTFESAKRAALCAQVQNDIKNNIQTQSGSGKKGRKRTKADSSSDLGIMLNELLQGNVFSDIPGRQYEYYKNFKDVNERLDLSKLHTWLTKQKERASYEMI